MCNFFKLLLRESYCLHSGLLAVSLTYQIFFCFWAFESRKDVFPNNFMVHSLISLQSLLKCLFIRGFPWSPYVKHLIEPASVFDVWLLIAIFFPFCPTFGQADKQAWLLHPSTPVRNSDFMRNHEPGPLTTIKTPSQSPFPVRSSHFWTCLGAALLSPEATK